LSQFVLTRRRIMNQPENL